MARKIRPFMQNIPCHITHRGHNKMTIFTKTGDYVIFLTMLKEAKLKYPLKFIHIV
jgi:hypothetical protein